MKGSGIRGKSLVHLPDLSTGIGVHLDACSFQGLCPDRLSQSTLLKYVAQQNRITNPYSVFGSAYLDILWTIPAEFRGSIAVFWFLTASSSLSTRARRIVALVVILLCYVWGVLYIASFLTGMLIADSGLDRLPFVEKSQHLTQQDKLPVKHTNRAKVTAIVAWGCLLLLGVLLLGQPSPDHYSSGDYPFPWRYLHAMIPTWYGWRQGEEFWYVVTSPTLQSSRCDSLRSKFLIPNRLSIASAFILVSLSASPARARPPNAAQLPHQPAPRLPLLWHIYHARRCQRFFLFVRRTSLDLAHVSG